MRLVGTLAEPVALARGDHACFSGRSASERGELVARYFRSGLRAQEKLLYSTDTDPVDEALRELSKRLPGTDDHLRSGALTVMPSAQAYEALEDADGEAMVERYRRATQDALDEGYTGLRVVGDATTLLVNLGPERLLAYEMAVDRLMASSRMTAVCLYDPARCDAEALAPIHTVHPVGIGEAGPTFRLFADDDGLTLVGEVDLGSSTEFRSALDSACRVYGDVRIDLSGLGFVDASGLRALLHTASRLRDDGRTMTVYSPQPLVRRCLELIDPDITRLMRVV